MIIRKINSKNKKGIEMGFNWLFAIIVGGFILFLAIFISGKFVTTQEKSLNTQTAAQLKSLFDPLETGLASGKSSEINFQKESRIYFDCDYLSNNPFGKQTVSFSEKTFGKEFGERGGNVPITDRYVFAENILEGKKITVFSKPFFMPFKVADLTVIISNDYCFYDSPEEIKEELEGLNLKSIKFMNSTIEKCEGIKVCFTPKDCDIVVSPEKKSVKKRSKTVYFEGELIYAAIFSSDDIYECNVRRLMNKLAELGGIYSDKINIIERAGCYSNLKEKLENLIALSRELKSSSDIKVLYEKADNIDIINEDAKSGCRLY